MKPLFRLSSSAGVRYAHSPLYQAVLSLSFQVVSTVLSLTGGSDLPAEEAESLERESIPMQDATVILKLTTIAILDASLADPALNAALSKRGATARYLVKRLTDAAPSPGGSSELQRKYTQLKVEVCSGPRNTRCEECSHAGTGRCVEGQAALLRDTAI